LRARLRHARFKIVTHNLIMRKLKFRLPTQLESSVDWHQHRQHLFAYHRPHRLLLVVGSS